MSLSFARISSAPLGATLVGGHGRVVMRAGHRRLVAGAYFLGGRPDVARKAVEEALALARRHGERGNEAEALRSSADVRPPVPVLT